MASITTAEKKSAKIEKKYYYCDACDYGTDDISNWKKHQKTPRHKQNANLKNKDDEIQRLKDELAKQSMVSLKKSEKPSADSDAVNKLKGR